MAKNLGKDVSMTYDNEQFGYDSVVFQQGRPWLDSEFNLSQQLQQDLLRKVARVNGSGWASYRDYYAEAGIENAFYTQELDNAIPEIAIVNGWPVYVTNTNTTQTHCNKIVLEDFPLETGYRVDGVFLEVWRGLIDDQMAGMTGVSTMPSDTTQLGAIKSVFALSESKVWIGGEYGLLCYSSDAGATWSQMSTPTSYTINCVKFINDTVGFFCGNNGTLYKTDNAGSSWSRIELGYYDNLSSIAIYDDSLVVVVGEKGTILRSTDLLNFTLIQNASQAAEDLTSVYLYDGESGWCVGKNGAFQKTIDGGTTWVVNTIKIASGSTEVSLSTDLNSVQFVNMSDGWIVGNSGLILRTTDGGSHWSDISKSIYDEDSELGDKYSSTSEDLLSLELVKSYSYTINLSCANNGPVSARYVISSTDITIYYKMTSSSSEESFNFKFSDYPTVTELATAISEYKVGGVTLFTATVQLNSGYISHETSGIINSINTTANINFSSSTIAWIGGTNGLILNTENGGARWKKYDTSTTDIGSDIYSISFPSRTTGWFVGAIGEISKVVNSSWTNQDAGTEITQQKVFFQGNVNTDSTKNLVNDSINSLIGVETSARTQIQYRIRVVEDINFSEYQESGLGSAYAHSRGPNNSTTLAGSYPFENMGSVNGDYGLWRSICRNTVDGYSYAIPMFLVTRRNKQPYSATNNINGSSVDDSYAIRPDGLIYTDIISEDILDTRKKITNVSLTSILSKSVDDLLSGKLRTSISQNTSNGGQVGNSILVTETLAAAQINSLLGSTGSSYNSEAFDVTGISPVLADSNTTYVPYSSDGLVNEVIEFAPLTNKMYNCDYSVFSSKFVTDDAYYNGSDVPGFFTGMGTKSASFVVDLSMVGATGFPGVSGLKYNIKGGYVDYSRTGLSNIPTTPVQVKTYLTSTDSSYSYQGVPEDTTSKNIRVLTTGANNVYDYVEITSNDFGEGYFSATDSLLGIGSMVRLHSFVVITDSVTSTVTIPKNNEGYFVVGVKYVKNYSTGSLYPIDNIESSGDDNSNLTVTVGSTSNFVKDTVVEIISEVMSTLSSEGDTAVGKASEGNVESTEALRNSYVSVFSKRIRGVDSLYKGNILKVDSSSGSNSYSISNSGGSGFTSAEGIPIGIETFWNGVKNVPYAWTIDSDSGVINEIVELENVELNDGILSFTTSETNASLYVGVLVKTDKGNVATNSSISVSYRSQVPQTLSPLPITMEVSFISCLPSMIISSDGCGGGYASDLFESPLSQIPLFDSLNQQSFFYNLYGLTFSSYYEEKGYVTAPLRVSRTPGSIVTLSSSGVDKFGLTYYGNTSEMIRFKSEDMLIGNPRKLFVPMLVKVESIITSPVVKGEVLLAILSSYECPSLVNEISIGPNTEKSVLGLYKVHGMPIIK